MNMQTIDASKLRWLADEANEAVDAILERHGDLRECRLRGAAFDARYDDLRDDALRQIRAFRVNGIEAMFEGARLYLAAGREHEWFDIPDEGLDIDFAGMSFETDGYVVKVSGASAPRPD